MTEPSAITHAAEHVQRERRVTTVIVTHDRSEAAELGDSIALMIEGRIVQHDEPSALFERPVSAAVARFFGVANLIADDIGTLAIRPEHVRLDSGVGIPATVLEAHYAGDHVRVVVDCDGRRIQAHVPPHLAPRAGQQVDVELPAEHVWRLPSSVPAAGETARAARSVVRWSGWARRG